jgi:hypothetical protein
MVRLLASLLCVFLASSCATSESTTVSWQDCAFLRTVKSLEAGIPGTWPVSNGLPNGVETQPIPLGTRLTDPINDAYSLTIHLVPSINSVYVERTGGTAGILQLYGPISLTGHCSAPSGAP